MPALQTIESVGTGDSVRAIEKFVEYAPFTSNRDEHTVRNYVKQILPILKERRTVQEASGVLLRASSNTEAAADTLLRATTSNAEVPAEQLLRPRSIE